MSTGRMSAAATKPEGSRAQNVANVDFILMPHARGKPRRSAKHGERLQAHLVGVGLTEIV